MRVVVTYESRGGNTRRAAELIAGGLSNAGAEVTLGAVGKVGLDAMASADMLFVGTWTDGFFFFGQRPASAGKIANLLPDVWGKPTYSFVTYAKNPGKAHLGLSSLMRAKGAETLGEKAFHRNRLEDEVTAFVDEVIETSNE